MASAQTPTENPTPSIPPPPKRESSDLYDARYWESAYRNIDEPPALLLKLQDDLTQSRRREAFWISVVVHLVVVLLVFNSQKLAQLFPRQTAMVMNPSVMPRDKDLTYLELPPDAQKVPKPHDTNVISDKDRVATSKTPELDRKELKKILDSARPGRPGPMTPPSPSQQPSPPAAASAPAPTQSQQGEQSAQVPPPPSPQNQIAKLQTPRAGSPNPFNTGPQYAGSQIDQATRAVGSNPGGYSGGGGDFGLGTGKQGRAFGNLDVLSDTMGVDFSSYLAQVLYRVKASWYNQIPESAKAPIMKKGKLSIEFAILKNGSVGGMKLAASSGDVALDRGAWGGITGANPFPPLPKEFAGQFLSLRFNFYYNPDQADLR